MLKKSKNQLEISRASRTGKKFCSLVSCITGKMGMRRRKSNKRIQATRNTGVRSMVLTLQKGGPVKIFLFFSFSIVFLISGCTAVTVKPVDSSLNIMHVCIKDCSEECFDRRILYLIQDGFQRHGITTEVYNSELPSECEYTLTYYCERARKMATYLRHAEIRLHHGKSEIGNVEYHLRGKGGFALNTWENTKSEIDPLIDELLSGFVTSQ
jgi:hypothetical protein